MDWIKRTPLAVILAFLEMLPRIEGRESLRRSDEVTVGSFAGVRSKAPGGLIRKIQQSWQRQQRGVRASRVLATPERLASMGIGMKVVKRG